MSKTIPDPQNHYRAVYYYLCYCAASGEPVSMDRLAQAGNLNANEAQEKYADFLEAGDNGVLHASHDKLSLSLERFCALERQYPAFQYLQQCLTQNQAVALQTLAQKAVCLQEEAYRRYAVFLRLKDGSFEVAPVLGQRTLSAFTDEVAHVCEVYRDVVIYQLYMPVTQERRLTRALDSLFYANTVKERLESIGHDRLKAMFPLGADGPEPRYWDELLQRVAESFSGYSVHQMRGRFRMSTDLWTRQEMASRLQRDVPYLEDETTACVTLLFRCGPGIPLFPGQPEERLSIPTFLDASGSRDADVVRFLFHHLFLEDLLKEVQDEQEIWLLETGMRTRLWVFSR